MHVRKAERHALLLLAAVLVAAALIFAVSKAGEDGTGQPQSFVLLLEGIGEEYVPCLHVGDRIVDRQNRRILGDIERIEATPAKAEVYSEKEEKLIEADVPGKCDVLLFVSALQGDGKEDRKNTVRIGEKYYFRTYGFVGEGQVVDLT